MKTKQFRIDGTITSLINNRGIPGLRVEAWDKDLAIDDFLGSAETGVHGEFTIEFDSSYYQEVCIDRNPDVYFKIYRGDELVHDTEDSVLWNAQEALESALRSQAFSLDESIEHIT